MQVGKQVDVVVTNFSPDLRRTFFGDGSILHLSHVRYLFVVL